MRVNDEGWLVADPGESLLRLPSVRSYALFTKGPIGVVWHYTGGASPDDGYAQRLAEGIMDYRHGEDRAASWHILIAKSGAVFQSVPCLKGSWHVGLPGVIGGVKLDNINRGTIGIELENAGRLKRVGARVYCWPYYKNGHSDDGLDPRCEVAVERAVDAQEGVFDGFPGAQEVAAETVLRALVDRFGLTRAVSGYGHRDFKPPSGKEDPGPVWAGVVLPRILDRVFPR